MLTALRVEKLLRQDILLGGIKTTLELSSSDGRLAEDTCETPLVVSMKGRNKETAILEFPQLEKQVYDTVLVNGRSKRSPCPFEIKFIRVKDRGSRS